MICATSNKCVQHLCNKVHWTYRKPKITDSTNKFVGMSTNWQNNTGLLIYVCVCVAVMMNVVSFCAFGSSAHGKECTIKYFLFVFFSFWQKRKNLSCDSFQCNKIFTLNLIYCGSTIESQQFAIFLSVLSSFTNCCNHTIMMATCGRHEQNEKKINNSRRQFVSLSSIMSLLVS